ncbi:MAG: hypothetical protein WBA17_07125 [Saprospiraceae bacterium]
MRPVQLSNIKLTDRVRFQPTIVGYNRLEGRPRTANFDRALKAEVRDALWMISKQWQVGEFQGDDAASPVVAKLLLHTSRMDRYQGGAGEVYPLPEDRPLEVEVERQRAQMRRAGRPVNLELRLSVGRYWKKLLRGAGLEGLIPEYVAQYPISAPDRDDLADIPRTAHPRVWQRFRAAAGRSLDGYALIEYLRSDPVAHRAGDSIPSADLGDQATLETLAGQLTSWWERLLEQQDDRPNDSWQPDYLEHRFAVSAPDPEGAGRQVFRAEEYYQGHLDWYNVDEEQSSNSPIGQAAATDTATDRVISFFPTNLNFGGMPDPRWWTLEERETSFTSLSPDTTDLNKLLVMDFQLQYANDWFMLPLGLPVGSVARVGGLLVTDTFGERHWIQGAGRGSDQNWERWSLFHPSIAGNAEVPASNDLLVLPAVPKVLEGKPREEIRLIRDEMANMVWALETQVALDDGLTRRGDEAARELYARYATGFTPVPEPAAAAPLRYKIVNSVPENWIPLVPVHTPGQRRQIQLQRAAMPRILPGDPAPPRKVEPRTGLLRTGLDESPAAPYFLHEEEVPRAGTRVRLSYQRTRWYNGRVYTWLGIRKTTGRGEGSSGLAFDQLV